MNDELLLVIEDGVLPGMNMETFAGEKIFRPRAQLEFQIRFEAEGHLRARFADGTYRDADVINDMLHHQFRFFSDGLARSLPPLASRDFMAFLLDQYERSTRIHAALNGPDVSSEELERWQWLEPTLRRALKYMAERVALLAPGEQPSATGLDLLDLTDRAFICAEEGVRLYNLSEQIHSLVPGEAVLTIEPRGVFDYLKLELDEGEQSEFRSRIRSDASRRWDFIPRDGLLFDLEHHNRFVGSALKDGLGLNLIESVGLLKSLIDGAVPAPDGFPIPFIHEEHTVQQFAEGIGVSGETVRRVLSGFSLTRQKMEEEERRIWKPKQEYRAYRRAFFEFPHPTGGHLTWSPGMARESLLRMIEELVFKKVPPEWRVPGVDRGLDALSNTAGKWFEGIVTGLVPRLGYTEARGFRKVIGSGADTLEIPPEIGDLDCLAYSPKSSTLLLLEAKLVRSGPEPAFFRDDVSKFVTGSGNYADQLRRKVRWLAENRERLNRALGSRGGLASFAQVNRICFGIVTYFPSYVYYAIKDFPCVSLTEFMVAHEVAGEWPYPRGSISVH